MSLFEQRSNEKNKCTNLFEQMIKKLSNPTNQYNMLYQYNML